MNRNENKTISLTKENCNTFVTLPNTKCMYDGHHFDGICYFIPESYSNGVYQCSSGTFCNLECMFAYMLGFPYRSITLFNFMCRDIYNVSEVQPAPPLSNLQCYRLDEKGIDIDQFRSSNFDYNMNSNMRKESIQNESITKESIKRKAEEQDPFQKTSDQEVLLKTKKTKIQDKNLGVLRFIS